MPATFAPRGTTLWSGEMFLESEVSESGVAHLYYTCHHVIMMCRDPY